jgi:release factor glutamine methyltransferase
MKNNLVSVKIIIDEFRKELSLLYPQEEIMQFLYLLFEEKMGWSRADVHINFPLILNKEDTIWFRDALDQLLKHRPIQYVIGSCQFLDLRIRVRTGVLIPRPETEELVEMLVHDYFHRRYEDLSLLDIGTGSGCISIAIKRHLPVFEVTALDISQVALQVAKENAESNHCKLKFLHADILDWRQWKIYPAYNVIVSNPPYILESERSLMRNNVTDYEPEEALFVKDTDPLKFYEAIAEFAFLHLIHPGSLYLEINERFGREVRNCLLAKGFNNVEVLNDIHGKERFICGKTNLTMLDTSYWHVEH